MAVIGGDLVKIKIEHPTVGSAVIFGVAGEDVTYKLGGLENEDNGAVNGAGILMLTKRRVPGYIQGSFSNDMSLTTPEFEFVRAVSNSSIEAKITFSHINGSDYGGKGTVVGEVTMAGKTSSFQCKFASGKGFEKL